MSVDNIKFFSKPSHMHDELENMVNGYMENRQNSSPYMRIKHDVEFNQIVVDGVAHTTVIVKEMV